ncbi:hypothetical protein C8F01DRAFT_1156285 [Mycena amicta]|nr:hypothetical protein C8F01DRAFT_1156285 [Mycena amicta]
MGGEDTSLPQRSQAADAATSRTSDNSPAPAPFNHPPSTETGSSKALSPWKEEHTPLVLDTLRRLSPGLLGTESPSASGRSRRGSYNAKVDVQGVNEDGLDIGGLLLATSEVDWDAFINDANYELSFSWKTPSRPEASPAGGLTVDPRFLHHPLTGSPIAPGSPQSYAEPSSSSRPSRSRPARAPADTWFIETPATVTRNRKRAAPPAPPPPPPPPAPVTLDVVGSTMPSRCRLNLDCVASGFACVCFICRVPPGHGPCPNCQNSAPTNWRLGIISQKMVCSACGLYESRKRKLRPPELQTKKMLRMRGGGKR